MLKNISMAICVLSLLQSNASFASAAPKAAVPMDGKFVAVGLTEGQYQAIANAVADLEVLYATLKTEKGFNKQKLRELIELQIKLDSVDAMPTTILRLAVSLGEEKEKLLKEPWLNKASKAIGEVLTKNGLVYDYIGRATNKVTIGLLAILSGQALSRFDHFVKNAK